MAEAEQRATTAECRSGPVLIFLPPTRGTYWKYWPLTSPALREEEGGEEGSGEDEEAQLERVSCLFMCPVFCSSANDSRKKYHEFYNMQAPPMEEVVDIQNPRQFVAFRECDLGDD